MEELRLTDEEKHERTKAAAAREFKISRRTVQRYADRYPSIMTKTGKVNLLRLFAAMTQHKKRDARGFPLRGKRPPAQLQKKAAQDEQNPPHFQKSFHQKTIILEKELRSLTEIQKQLLLSSWLKPTSKNPTTALDPKLVIGVLADLNFL